MNTKLQIIMQEFSRRRKKYLFIAENKSLCVESMEFK